MPVFAVELLFSYTSSRARGRRPRRNFRPQSVIAASFTLYQRSPTQSLALSNRSPSHSPTHMPLSWRRGRRHQGRRRARTNRRRRAAARATAEAVAAARESATVVGRQCRRSVSRPVNTSLHPRLGGRTAITTICARARIGRSVLAQILKGLVRSCATCLSFLPSMYEASVTRQSGRALCSCPAGAVLKGKMYSSSFLGAFSRFPPDGKRRKFDRPLKRKESPD